MAIIDNCPWGEFRGSVGNLVFKGRKGKTYISSTPGQYTTPMDDDSVGRRNTFGFSSKLFSALGRIYWFKEFWNNCSVYGDTFMHKMYTLNSPLIKNDGDISEISLIPFEKGSSGVPVMNTSITLDDRNVIAGITFPGEGIKNKDHFHWISCQGVIYLSGSSEVKKYDYAFIPVTIIDQPINFDTPLIFNYKLDAREFKSLKNHRNRNILLNFLVKDINGVPIIASENIYASFVDESIIPAPANEQNDLEEIPSTNAEISSVIGNVTSTSGASTNERVLEKSELVFRWS